MKAKATPLDEALAALRVNEAQIMAEGHPVHGPVNEQNLLRYATRQLPRPLSRHHPTSDSVTSGAPPRTEDLDAFARTQPASIALDRALQRSRDHLAPVVLVTLGGTWPVPAQTPTYIPLPQEARLLVIQNNSDLAGPPGHVSLSWDGTPAAANDYIIRSGQEKSFSIFAEQRTICLWSTANLTVNPSGGAGWAGGLWIGFGI